MDGGYHPGCRDASADTNFTGGTPIAVLCDNSRDNAMIPSDLSDFNRVMADSIGTSLWSMSRRSRLNGFMSSRL